MPENTIQNRPPLALSEAYTNTFFTVTSILRKKFSDMLNLFYSPNLYGFDFCHPVQVIVQQRTFSQTLNTADLLHLTQVGRNRKVPLQS